MNLSTLSQEQKYAFDLFKKGENVFITGPGKGDNRKIVENALKYKKNKASWKGVRVLIIDEVSMMSVKVLEVLDTIAKNARYINAPFGGIQVIFLGDFYQLPPVGTMGDEDTEKFCFESKLWSELFPLKNLLLPSIPYM